MRQLLVNADDFGLTPGVAHGILKAHREGVVTCATVLINTPHLDLVLRLLKDAPALDLGLHLNVTWGKPVSDPAKLSTLLGEDGRFIRRTDFEGVDLDEVKREWLGQIKKARAHGLPLSHLDTHHHTHKHPAFLDLIAELAAQEHLAVRSQAGWIRDYLRANGIRTTDHFIEDFYGEGKTSLEHLEDLLRLTPEGTVEVCCHPALVDDELRKISSYNEPRSEELSTLTQRGLKTWLDQNEISLTNFSALPVQAQRRDPSCDLKEEP